MHKSPPRLVDARGRSASASFPMPMVRDLASVELVAAILRGRTSVASLPRALRELTATGAALDDAGGLLRLALDPELEGLGARSRLRLMASIELGLRVAGELATSRAPPLPDPMAVAAWGARLLALDHEELWLLALDGRNGLRGARRVAVGGLHGLQVALGDPLRLALRAGASVFVLIHNHPSGDSTPSEEDCRFTTRVAEAATLIGVPLIDHVVVARGGHTSMLERGLLAPVRE